MGRLENPRSYGCWRKPATATPTSPTGRPTARGWTPSSWSTSRNQVGGGPNVGEELTRQRLLAPAKPRPHQDVLHTLKNAECSARSYVRQCQSAREGCLGGFWRFWHPAWLGI